MRLDELGSFDSVLDVGGNVGEIAELCRLTWPEATITSFEPVPRLAQANEERARGRWLVEQVALGAVAGDATIHYCRNQHSASTLLEPGTLRRERFGIVDHFDDHRVKMRRLDEWRSATRGRLLVKVDVEGFELEVLRGAPHVLELAAVVVLEVNQAPDIFVGAPSFVALDDELAFHGLRFVGVAGVQLDPAGVVVQFDGVWSRERLRDEPGDGIVNRGNDEQRRGESSE